MTVRDWTPGQLVVFWLVLAVTAFLIMVGLSFWRQNDFLLQFLVWLFFFVILSIPGLAVTWVWMGRNRSS